MSYTYDKDTGKITSDAAQVDAQVNLIFAKIFFIFILAVPVAIVARYFWGGDVGIITYAATVIIGCFMSRSVRWFMKVMGIAGLVLTGIGFAIYGLSWLYNHSPA